MMSLMFAATLFFRQQLAITENLGALGLHPDPKLVAATIADVKDHTFTWSLVPGVISIYLKAAIFASLTLLISTFATSWIFTIIISTMVYLIGHFEGVAREYWLSGPTGSLFARGFLLITALVFPDLQLFNLVDDIVAGNSIPALLFAKTVGLGGIYVCVYLLLAYFLFAKKEL
jgi:hypothetical protein